jgi:hypothetical protein
MRHRTVIATSVIAVAVVLLLVACGGNSSGPSAAHLGGAASPAAGSGSVGPGSPDFMAQLLKYAAYMREHGVPNFPDPNASDGFAIHVDPSSPAFRAAQATCHKLLPGGGTPTRGVITDLSGVILVFPSALAMRSPAFAQAEAACNLGIRAPS